MDRSNSGEETPSAQKVVVNDDDNVPPQTHSSPPSDVVDSKDSSKRPSLGLPQITHSGLHMPPEVLGTREVKGTSDDEAGDALKNSASDTAAKPRRPNIITKQQHRQQHSQYTLKKEAIRAAYSQAAAAAAAEALRTTTASAPTDDPASLITLLVYRGMELLVTETNHTVVALCPRTHVVLQVLFTLVPSSKRTQSNDDDEETMLSKISPIVALTSNRHSGLIAVCQENGEIRTFYPIKNTETEWGVYRWVPGKVIQGASIFYDAGSVVRFGDRRTSAAGDLVDLSTSANHRLLIAHQQQLALVDTAPALFGKDTMTETASTAESDTSTTTTPLLWTTAVASPIQTAKLSGDGNAIVVVLAGDDRGALTFTRDFNDGSSSSSNLVVRQSSTAGLVFKRGPLLAHTSPVTRLSFRGLGHLTSTSSENNTGASMRHSETTIGNDLLLTYCRDDSTVRIFNQAAWSQLLMWTTPPNSRADWIHGSSAWSLGDLESALKKKNSSGGGGASSAGTGSKPNSRVSSSTSLDTMGTGGINSVLQNSGRTQPPPSTSAGAWIAELTFQNAFPALRLSRLSYMKRGSDELQPAYFESVAAILPAGSIAPTAVLDSDDMGLYIQGVWPAWNPWLSEPQPGSDEAKATDSSLSGSAMAFLGLSSVPPPTSAYFGDSFQGGTHSPPTELRILATHPSTGKVVVMEFPLWGDEDFGAIELGSPLRYVLSVKDSFAVPHIKQASSLPLVSMDFESSRLCARIMNDSRSVEITWRKQGSLSLFAPGLLPEEVFTAVLKSSDPEYSEIFQDTSVVPVPLELPPLRIPRGTTSIGVQETILAVFWWQDDAFGGPPLLLAFTSSSSILLFEIPPPWCALEPLMPDYDPFSNGSVAESSADGTGSRGNDSREMGNLSDETNSYDVLVTPHPDFGLGLRLESPMDGCPPVAGSFKKHPLTGGLLPAEKTGQIVLGDELFSVNGVLLEGMNFDDVIATVRNVGAESSPGKPLLLRFRPVTGERQLKLLKRKSSLSRQDSSGYREAPSTPTPEGALDRRSMQDILGLSPGRNLDQKRPSFAARRRSDTDHSLLVGSTAEAQLEFGRLISVLKHSLPEMDKDSVYQKICLVSCTKDYGSYLATSNLRATAFIVALSGNSVYSYRLELSTSMQDNERTRIFKLGEVNVCPENLHSISFVDKSEDGFIFNICDRLGASYLLTMKLEDKKSGAAGASSSYGTSFDCQKIFQMSAPKQLLVRSSSQGLFATSDLSENSVRNIVQVWSARPDPTSRKLLAPESVSDPHFDKCFVESQVHVDMDDLDSEIGIKDLCFLETGRLDAFPPLVVFLSSKCVLLHRRGDGTSWKEILRFEYPSFAAVNPHSARNRDVETKAQDYYPHIMPALTELMSSFDEFHELRSDWSPENLLSLVCTNEHGAKGALIRDVRSIFLWLASITESTNDPYGNTQLPLAVTPLEIIDSSDTSLDDLSNQEAENASSVMNVISLREKSPKDDLSAKLENFQAALGRRENFVRKTRGESKSILFQMALSEKSQDPETSSSSSLPPVLARMDPDELRILWAIGEVASKPPRFQALDSCGQLALVSYHIFRNLQQTPKEEQAIKSPSGMSDFRFSTFHMQRQTSTTTEKTRLHSASAAAGSVAALITGKQKLLLECLRNPGEKLSWGTARDLRLPFWVRSDDTLRNLSEEIGQQMYRESRDILKSALFFLVAGKKRTLMNLAAADQSDSGRKFFKFLTGYDFSSERGRRAAEKNAFSLLRKNQYDSAAAFFLLAEPPILKSAVETIATKMDDMSLAFLVARIMGNQSSSTGVVGGQNFSGLSGFGGGGGYAGSGTVVSDPTPEEDCYFADWSPMLGKIARDFLRDRGLPSALQDSSFYALQLLWLGRREEASHWLSGYLGCKDGLLPEYFDDNDMPTVMGNTDKSLDTHQRVISAANKIINFTSGPFLLRKISAGRRTCFASSLLVSRCLARKGLELPSMKVLLQSQISDEGDTPLRNTVTPKEDSTVPHEQPSSIFDDFATAPTPQKKNVQAKVSNPQSSIFDDFKPAPKQQSAEQANSSIFDSFAPAPVAKVPSTSGEMTSSIFDDFEAPPRQKLPSKPEKPGSTPDQMTSSIFDNFEPAPTPSRNSATPSTNSVTASGQLASSIFDDFAPAPRPKLSTHPPASTTVTSASGQLSSSIFDDFEPSPRQQAVSNEPLGTKSKLDDVVEEKEHQEVDESDPERQTPALWNQWKDELLVVATARRLLRELTSLTVSMYGDAFDSHLSYHSAIETSPSQMANAGSQILHTHCDAEVLVKRAKDCLNSVASVSNLDAAFVARQSIEILRAPFGFDRLSIAVLLHLMIDDLEAAEDIIRDVSQSLIAKVLCHLLSKRNIDIGQQQNTSPSMHARRVAARTSWQLEICLWIHRGGALPLTGLALNEAIVAVRIGLVISSWNENFECLETIIRHQPDCLLDTEAGRQLCTSLKMLADSPSLEKKSGMTGSGGWEFLVECKRAEATEMLRPRPTGAFIIRPHSEDHGVFTLSFKTNLVPEASTRNTESGETPENSGQDAQQGSTNVKNSRSVRRDDVVQHAIVRLSDSGFRCGSFGPFATLLKLLEAVSSSLPFDLRFDLPPTDGAIKEEGNKPSPSHALFRKLALSRSVKFTGYSGHRNSLDQGISTMTSVKKTQSDEESSSTVKAMEKERAEADRSHRFSMFTELLVLSEIRKQLSCVAAARYNQGHHQEFSGYSDDVSSVGTVSTIGDDYSQRQFAEASRMIRPLLCWCRQYELLIGSDLAPGLEEAVPSSSELPMALNASETAIEICTTESAGGLDRGDAIVRRMIKSGSGVEFRTLRLGDASDSAMVVLFSKKEALDWLIANNVEKTEADALKRLQLMEQSRVIEPVDLKNLAPQAYQGVLNDSEEIQATEKEESAPNVVGVRYRFVDPWEVEPLGNREGETRGASLGRHRFLAFSLGYVASSCEDIFRSLGGKQLLELWAAAKGGIALTKAVATVHSPWERDAGGDLIVKNGAAIEPSAYANCLSQHLYRNTLFRRLSLPQRYLALVQVELLDLKNLTSPGGSLSLSVYALLRLKRSRSGKPITLKARTLDSVATHPMKLGKSTGPNAPASWGSLVRFRFPLPEYTGTDRRSFDHDREALFKGPPSVLQVSVYEKKFMSDSLLGGADVKLDGLTAGGQLEEWVPLKTETHGINWFARIRLTLRFELMCLCDEHTHLESVEELAPSVGLRRIGQLIDGGLHEDIQKSASTPDLMSYFESMVNN